MRITFINDVGQSFVIEIDPQMSLEDIMALLEAEVRHLLCLTEKQGPLTYLGFLPPSVWDTHFGAKHLP